MGFSLLPGVMTDAVTDLTPEALQAAGVRLLMLDFDNTIVPYTTDIPTERMEAWLSDMQRSDIRICVVSNSRKGRVPAFCASRGIACITRAGKPGTAGIRSCLRRYGISPEQAALAGDQIYTDVLGANRAGVLPILVRAIDNHNLFLKVRHVLELPVILFSRSRIVKK